MNQAATATAPPIPDRWILNPVADLILFVATPALILPGVMIAQNLWTSEQIYLFVASFGALGHHLPGMMRAYGDRTLFDRFRTRFIVAPLFLLLSCISLAFMAQHALILTVFAWGMWHGLMQTHGFARIYDAKVKSFARTTALLDQGLCIGWFASAIVFSPTRVLWIMDRFYLSGGPAVHAEILGVLRIVVGSFTALVTAAWIANAIRSWLSGHPPSPVKVLLLASSLAFYFYANAIVADLLIAVVLFEIFHDVQYLSIVWLFNRRRVDSDPGVGKFTSFVFRPSRFLVLFYVGLVFLYGSMNYVKDFMPTGMLQKVLIGILAASALLHFYYDGFIWKVREKETRKGLGIEGGDVMQRRVYGLPRWAFHVGLWMLLFVLPVGLLGIASARGPMDEANRAVALATAFPDDAAAQRNLAVALQQNGDTSGALAASRRALELAGEDEETAESIRADLALILVEAAQQELDNGSRNRALDYLEEAYEIDESALDRVTEPAIKLTQQERHEEALRVYRAVLIVDPDHGHAQFNAAVSLAALGKLEEAHWHARRAVELMPREPAARQMLRQIDMALHQQGAPHQH